MYGIPAVGSGNELELAKDIPRSLPNAPIEDCFFGNLNNKCLPEFLAEIASGYK